MEHAEFLRQVKIIWTRPEDGGSIIYYLFGHVDKTMFVQNIMTFMPFDDTPVPENEIWHVYVKKPVADNRWNLEMSDVPKDGFSAATVFALYDNYDEGD